MSNYDEQKKVYDAWIASDSNVKRTMKYIDMFKKKLSASKKLGSEESVEEQIAKYEHRLGVIRAELGILGVVDAQEEHPKDFDMAKCMSSWMVAAWDAYNERTDREFLIFSENDFYSYLNHKTAKTNPACTSAKSNGKTNTKDRAEQKVTAKPKCIHKVKKHVVEKK